MRRGGMIGLGLVALLLAASPAQANTLCKWVGWCRYESPGFRFRVVDAATGQPLPGVHALAEWVLEGVHGRNGPLFVQDAVSGPDGMVVFPPWGPVSGPRTGLVLSLDPALSLFKAGYRTLVLQNNFPRGTEPTTQLRRFGDEGKTFPLESFRGSDEEWLRELERAIAPGFRGRASEEQVRPFHRQYLNRDLLVWNEHKKLPMSKPAVRNFFLSLEEDIVRSGGQVR